MDTVIVVHRSELSPDTAQTSGMRRISAIDRRTAGSERLWVGEATVEHGTRSGAHHHGECDSVVCITRGRVLIRFGERLENSAEAGPGDYVFIPAHVVHQEINLSDSEAIDSIVIRSGDNVVISVELPADVLQA